MIYGMNNSRGEHPRTSSVASPLSKFKKVKQGTYVSTLSPAT